MLTMFGIIIATAMFCVVLAARTSCVDILKSFRDDDYGNWHVQAYSMTSKDYQKIIKDSRIRRSTYVQEVGYILNGEDISEEETKDILAYQNYNVLVASMGQGFTDLCNIQLVKGRYPENENEAIISLEMLADNKDLIDTNPDSYYILKYGSRYSEGHKVNDLKSIHRDKDGRGTESLYSIGEVEFKVVGYFVVPEYTRWKNLSRYTVLLGPSSLSVGNAVNAYFELKDPSEYTAFSEEMFDSENACLYNKNYIRMKDSADDTKTIRWLDLLAVSALSIILMLAVMLIYNSFSTSSTERIRAIGLLKSVGATKRQVRNLMMSEAFYYIIIAIPIGILIGNLSAMVLFYYLENFVKEAGSFLLSQTVDLRYRFSMESVLCPALLSIVTIFVAILVPMVRTSNITPIEAVRVNNVFTTKPLRKKSRGLGVRLLGFTGALSVKNFLRYRKRYHAPILSILLSILMIFSTNTLVNVISSHFSEADSSNADLLTYSYYFGNNLFDNEEKTLYYRLADLEGIKDSLIILQTRKNITVSSSLLNQSTEAVTDVEGVDNITVNLLFIEDSSFRRLCTDNGIDPEPYLTYGSKLCLTNNQVTSDEDGKYLDKTVFKDSSLPVGVTMHFEDDDVYSEEKGRDVEIILNSMIPQPYIASGDSSSSLLQVYMPLSRMDYYSTAYRNMYEYFMFRAEDPEETYETMRTILQQNLHSDENLHDAGAYARARESVIALSKVLIYGFAVLLCMICFLNVVMTLLTSILFRRKEYILLTSVGMSRKTLFRMVITESMICFFGSILILVIVLAVLFLLVSMFLDIDIFTKRNLLFIAITAFAHLFMVVSTTAFGLKHVMSENVIEGIRKDYY